MNEFFSAFADMSASSSKEHDNNQHYFDYLQREYQLLEQRLSMGTALPNDSQFCHSPSISNHQFTTDSSLKLKSKNWSFPSFKQSQCPQHVRFGEKNFFFQFHLKIKFLQLSFIFYQFFSIEAHLLRILQFTSKFLIEINKIDLFSNFL